MRKSISLFIALIFAAYSYAQTKPDSSRDSLMTLDEIPAWILKNIQFPQEAYEYGAAGIEQVCISASWDGKVFITRKLNTLTPAFEKEIMNVVSKAPKCRYSGSQPQDIYKFMLIDFYKYIPEDRQAEMQKITLHTPPRLANITSNPFYARDKYIEWIHNNIRIPSILKCYSDTITFQYTVTRDGKVNNISILQYKDDRAKEALKHALKKSPKWKPSVANGTTPIDVTICDKIIIQTDDKAKLLPFTNYVDDIFCNTKSIPTDPDMVIVNPEIKATYNGETGFFKHIMQDVVIDKKISVNGSFIIERDGTTSHINIANSPDAKTDSIVTSAITRTKWIAATQGGTPVRTLYPFGIKTQPRKQKQSQEISYYDIFGKYFIALQASPMRTSYRFIQRDGSIHNYPFNSQGLFDYEAYYKGMLYYHQHTSGKNGNLSKKYFDQIYKMYVGQ